MHTLGYRSQFPLERCSDKFVTEGLLSAQAKSWDYLRQLEQEMVPGITHREAVERATGLARQLGSQRVWHKPVIRFGRETTFTFSEKSDPDSRLGENDIFFLDLGPVWSTAGHEGIEYEGDVGETFTRGTSPEQAAIASRCKELFRCAADHWREHRTTGAALYQWLSKKAEGEGYTLLMNVDGHRIGDFPHAQYAKAGLGEIDFVPSSDVWVLEVQLKERSGAFGAFYEDILR